MPRRYYEDLTIDAIETSTPLAVDREAMIAFARQYDPQYFHADEQQARSSIFGDVVASGQYTMVLWRQLDHRIAHDIAWICGVAWDDVRWPVAVRAGDALRARAWCMERRPSSSDPSRGVVTMQYQLINQDDVVVFSARSTNLIERRDAT